MQIWIYFAPGTGGDGIANLLEHSTNINTIDHNTCIHATPKIQYWRVDRFVDNRPKFWTPQFDKLCCFRQNQRFNSDTNSLSQVYIDLVESNINTIVTSHDCSLKNLHNSDCREIFTKNQIKILLQSNNRTQTIQNALEKNLICYNKNSVSEQITVPVSRDNFDYVVDADQLMSSWHAVKTLTQSIGLDLDKKFFDEFSFIRNGQQSNLYSATTPRYKTVVDHNGVVTYKKL